MSLPGMPTESSILHHMLGNFVWKAGGKGWEQEEQKTLTWEQQRAIDTASSAALMNAALCALLLIAVGLPACSSFKTTSVMRGRASVHMVASKGPFKVPGPPADFAGAQCAICFIFTLAHW